MKIKIFDQYSIGFSKLEIEVNKFLETVRSPKIFVVGNNNSIVIIVSYEEERDYRGKS